MANLASLMSGVKVMLFDAVANGVQTGTAIALLARAQLITWQAFYGSAPGSVTMLVETSDDNVNWFTAASTTNTAGDGGTFQTAAAFIRGRITGETGGSTTSLAIVGKPL